jgi:tetratricopeptide (TPR) repeat protein
MRTRQSLAMAYVKGGRFVEARRVLEEAVAAQPANQILTNALARVLATAPDGRARDGRRALELAQKLFEATRIPETGETYAMALAEAGRFDEAIKLQQETIVAIERSAAQVSRDFVTGNLAQYQKHQPSGAPLHLSTQPRGLPTPCQRPGTRLRLRKDHAHVHQDNAHSCGRSSVVSRCAARSGHACAAGYADHRGRIGRRG